MKRNPRYLAAVRALPCSVPDCRTTEPVHAHHVRTAANSGTGLKPPDDQTVPLCQFHHLCVHEMGAATFQRRYLVNFEEAVRFTQQAVRQPMP